MMATKPPPPPTEAGPALDAWLAEWVMDYAWCRDPARCCNFLESPARHHLYKDGWLGVRNAHWEDQIIVPQWSTSIALALDEVGKAMRKRGYGRRTVASPHVTETCVLFIHHEHLDWHGEATADTEAAAVCLAASQAVYAELTR